MKWTVVIVILQCFVLVSSQNEFVVGTNNELNMEMRATVPVRYLLYEVNPGEGFNLRRDVYLRVANMVKFLNVEPGQQWVLVLPAWTRMYHWRNHRSQLQEPWKKFFDLSSLQRHIPVMEVTDWMKVVGEPAIIDEVYYLQRYKEGWENGKWSDRYDIRPCLDSTRYHKDDESGLWDGQFWNYDIRAKSFECLSVQSDISFFTKFLIEETKGRSVMIHRAESLIHGKYSEWSREWWTGRRSMRFSQRLHELANEFRKTYLDSDDERDKTVVNPDWTQQQKALGEAVGGPYLSVHLRRQDFKQATKIIPSLETAAERISEELEKLGLKKVFVATDSPVEEFEELKKYLKIYDVYRYIPSAEEHSELTDGGVAIIDQLIAAHARHFIGTGTSTFTFRINEERSLLGFSPDSTYNRFCGVNESKEKCAKEQPSRWFPVY